MPTGHAHNSELAKIKERATKLLVLMQAVSRDAQMYRGNNDLINRLGLIEDDVKKYRAEIGKQKPYYPLPYA